MSSVHIVTFADRRMAHMHRRFRRQAASLGVFSSIFCLTERDLDDDFRVRFRDVLNPEVRGFGYFVWKPQVILQVLRKIPEGDLVLYLDSGSHLVETGRPRFMEYLELCESSSSGVLAFELPHTEKSWTKADLLAFMGVSGSPKIFDTRQVQAGAIFLRNAEEVRRLVEEWLSVFVERFDLVDDSPSVLPNHESFVEHRHDQSVFSILAKRHGAILLSASEQYPERNPGDWSSLTSFPLHHRRDKSSKFKKFSERAARRFVPMQSRLVRMKGWVHSFLGARE